MKRNVSETIEELTDEERKLYDRQIRLWGLEAQRRLNKFRVCVAGMTGLGAEVAKNVILAGVAQVTLMDHKEVLENDFRSQFMVKPQDLGKNRASASLSYARRLNPMVKTEALEEDILEKDDSAFLKQFDMLVVCDMIPLKRAFDLDDRCRKNNVKLIFGHVLAGMGFFISDLMNFDFVGEVINHLKDGKQVKNEPMNRLYPPMREIMNVRYVNKRSGAALTKRTNKCVLQLYLLLEFYKETADSIPTKEDLENLLPKVAERLGAPEERFEIDLLDEILSHEPGPVAATVGGVLGQEVVKVASQNCVPFHNSFVFDVDTCQGVVELLK
ncbi:SUMO-activating enzyme subunit 1 [Galendromus occidentalis]|uniref:SUMO-activating enzyme subunit 1 n=1 Tax=Galendromus occidentalis TaxID=34638 RepID=A0AAJ6VWE9_9ACAR|nr:SUMO-activating enzyme subunit 1 [Galendromus occidentalis]